MGCERRYTILDEYQSRAYQEYDYLSLADAYAYSFAVTAGDYYEVTSTYDSFESQQPGRFCYQQGANFGLRAFHNPLSLPSPRP